MTRQSSQAFTRWDLIICLAAIGMLALWLPLLARSKVRVSRLGCSSNLRQIGLGFRMWSNDHADQFPWRVPTNEDGTLEYAESRDVFRHFVVASNELNSPRILACPDDHQRSRTTVFDFVSNANLSYFIEIKTNRDQVYLSGDRFLSTNKSVRSGMMTISTAKSLRWVPGAHVKSGNIVFSDGSVAQTANGQLGTTFTNLPIRIAIP
jgi:hypothetical protein